MHMKSVGSVYCKQPHQPYDRVFPYKATRATCLCPSRRGDGSLLIAWMCPQIPDNEWWQKQYKMTSLWIHQLLGWQPFEFASEGNSFISRKIITKYDTTIPIDSRSITGL